MSFQVTGVDASDVAIEKAKAKALEASVKCDFAVVDIRKSRVDGVPFGFAFDEAASLLSTPTRNRRAFARR